MNQNNQREEEERWYREMQESVRIQEGIIERERQYRQELERQATAEREAREAEARRQEERDNWERQANKREP